MKYYIYGILATLFVVTVAAWNSKYDTDRGTPRVVAEQMQTNVVVLSHNTVPEYRRGMGTGVWLDEYYLLTNCHVAAAFRHYIRNEESGELDLFWNKVTISGDRNRLHFKGEVLACDEGRDLALIRSDWPNYEAVTMELDWRIPNFGTVVYSAGHHFNTELAPKIGIMGMEVFDRGNLRMSFSMPIAPGDSGSPIFDRWGALIGLVNSGYTAQTFRGERVPLANIAYGIPGWSINAFLDEHMQ